MHRRVGREKNQKIGHSFSLHAPWPTSPHLSNQERSVGLQYFSISRQDPSMQARQVITVPSTSDWIECMDQRFTGQKLRWSCFTARLSMAHLLGAGLPKNSLARPKE